MKFIALIAAGVAFAQTAIKPDQLKAVAPDAFRPTLLAYTTAKGFVAVTLGAGITVTQSPTGYVIDVAPPAAPKVNVVLVQSILARAADGTYAAASNAVICRNGIRQRLNADYTIANGRIVPTASWAADDDVTADEWRVE